MATNVRGQGYYGSNAGYGNAKYNKKNLTAVGYPSSTAGTTGMNGTAKGYPSSMDGYTPTTPNASQQGYIGSTALQNNVYAKQPTTSYSSTGSSGYSSSKKKTSTKSSTGTATAQAAAYPTYDMTYDTTPAKQYGGDYDILTGEYIGGNSGSSFDAEAAYRSLLDTYKNQQSNYEKYLEQMKEAAQAAYDKGLASLNSAYDSQLSSLSGNYDSQKNQLLDAYNRSKYGLSTDAENSLRQAYINNMMNQRNLNQRLSSMGLTGGATETTLASMLNNYGNARNDINKTLANNLYNLEGNYNGNLAEALREYNAAVASANMAKAQRLIDLENTLASNNMNAMSNYQNMLANYNNGYIDILRSALASGVNLS